MILELKCKNDSLYFKKDGISIDNSIEVKNLLYDFISRNYINHIYKDTILLEGKNDTLKIVNYKGVKENKYFNFLFDSIESNKYYCKSKQTTKKKVNRSNKYAGKTVTTIMLVFAMTAGIAVTQSQKVGDFVETLDDNINTNDIIENDNIIEEVETYEFMHEDKNLNIDFGSRIDDGTLEFVNNTYKEAIHKYSQMYGIDEKIISAIICQESSGNHFETASNDYSGIGLMQIEMPAHLNDRYNIYQYNSDTNDFSENVFVIEWSDVRGEETNIETGCVILARCLRTFNYNLPLALQAYNFGETGLENILKQYAEDNGKTLEEVKNDVNDLGWMEYLNLYPYGDKNYVSNVLRYLPDGNLTFKQPIEENGKFNCNEISYNIMSLEEVNTNAITR